MTKHKEHIRQAMIQKRIQYNQNEIDFSECLKDFEIILHQYKPQKIASYYAIKGEPSMDAFHDVISKKSNALILYPHIHPSSKILTFHVPDKGEISSLGVKQPTKKSPYHQPDMIICPFVAVDKHYRRLGFGGGYYDQTISQITPKPLLVGIGYAFQICEKEAFGEPHDLIYDHLLVA